MHTVIAGWATLIGKVIFYILAQNLPYFLCRWIVSKTWQSQVTHMRSVGWVCIQGAKHFVLWQSLFDNWSHRPIQIMVCIQFSTWPTVLMCSSRPLASLDIIKLVVSRNLSVSWESKPIWKDAPFIAEHNIWGCCLKMIKLFVKNVCMGDLELSYRRA